MSREDRFLLSRREFGQGVIATGVAGSLLTFPTNYASADTRSPSFYLNHWSSTLGIHPRGGRAGRDVELVTHVGNGPQTRFLFEYVEGPWGYIISEQDPRYCVHPRGGRTNPTNDTFLLLHTGRHPGAYFAFDQAKKLIRHIGGKYWHPYKGKTHPGNNNGIVLFSSHNLNTKFFATSDGRQQQDIALPAKTRADWKLVFAEDNPVSSGYKDITVFKKVSASNTTSTSTEFTIGLEVEGKLFGAKSKGSTSLKNTWAKEATRSIEQSSEIKSHYTWEKGQGIAVWQRVFVADFDDGATYEFSKTVTTQTSNSNIRPPVVE